MIPSFGIWTNSEGQVKYCRGTFFGHATPDRAGARPYRVQCRVAQCDIGLPAHTSHRFSRVLACFAGPISQASRERYRLEPKKKSVTDHRIKRSSD